MSPALHTPLCYKGSSLLSECFQNTVLMFIKTHYLPQWLLLLGFAPWGSMKGNSPRFKKKKSKIKFHLCCNESLNAVAGRFLLANQTDLLKRSCQEGTDEDGGGVGVLPVLWCSDSTPCDKKLTRCCSAATWRLPGAPPRLCSAAFAKSNHGEL